MRIISGKLKGKTLSFLKSSTTRPLKDSVKENIFNILDHSTLLNIIFKNSNILDLYSGIGSFGLECISRGAKKVKFIENYHNALKILNKNILDLKVLDKCEIIKQDCFDFFKNKEKFLKDFEIIFIDPPYKEEKLNLIIEEIKDRKILNDNGVIVIHRHKLDKLEISKKLKIFDVRNYGISKIIIGN